MAEPTAQEKYMEERAKEVALAEATDKHTKAQHTYLNAIQEQAGNSQDEDLITSLHDARKELTEASSSLLKLTTEKE